MKKETVLIAAYGTLRTTKVRSCSGPCLRNNIRIAMVKPVAYTQ